MAAAGTSPIAHQPSSAAAAIVNGIEIASSRHVDVHPERLGGRSSFNPAPINATTTPSSVSRSTRTPYSSGSTTGRPLGTEKTVIPKPT